MAMINHKKRIRVLINDILDLLTRDRISPNALNPRPTQRIELLLVCLEYLLSLFLNEVDMKENCSFLVPDLRIQPGI